MSLVRLTGGDEFHPADYDGWVEILNSGHCQLGLSSALMAFPMGCVRSNSASISISASASAIFS